MSDESPVAAQISLCPPAMQEIIEEFREATPRERMDYLLEYAMSLPPLPERLQSKRDQMEQVHECQSPVFLFTEVHNGTVQFFVDVPMEAPTVRGYASLLVEGFQEATADEILATPDNIHILFGLHEVITPQRLRGLHALLHYMKRQVRTAEALYQP